MAFISSIMCYECGQMKEVVRSSGDPWPRSCADCQQAKDASERTKHFAELDELTIHQRIRKIEEWIYDYKPTHVPPPRF